MRIRHHLPAADAVERRGSLRPLRPPMRAAVAHQSCDQMFQRRKVSSGDHITARGDCPARVQPEPGASALLRRAIARRARPPCAIGVEAKSCSEFRAEAVVLPIFEPPGRANRHHGSERTKVWRRITSLGQGAKRLTNDRAPIRSAPRGRLRVGASLLARSRPSRKQPTTATSIRRIRRFRYVRRDQR